MQGRRDLVTKGNWNDLFLLFHRKNMTDTMTLPLKSTNQQKPNDQQVFTKIHKLILHLSIKLYSCNLSTNTLAIFNQGFFLQFRTKTIRRALQD